MDGLIGAIGLTLFAIACMLPSVTFATGKPEDMTMHDLSFKADSSAIDSVKYDASEQVMSIQFTNSDTAYKFYNVPRVLVVEFEAAESHGKFYNANIRGKFSE